MGNIPLLPTPSCYCSGLGAWAKSPSVHLSFHKFQKSRASSKPHRVPDLFRDAPQRNSKSAGQPNIPTKPSQTQSNSVFLALTFFCHSPRLFFAIVCVWALLACLVDFGGVQATGSAGLTTGFRVRGPVVCLSTA
jgi:hypothetical protein